jgi:23S rRNA pseudouridine1911/1915/1917 synthase
MKENNQLEFYPTQDFESVEKLLLVMFQCSKNKLKKYFDKKILNLEVKARKKFFIPIDFANDGIINCRYEGPEIETVFEDQNFLVLNKPSNIFVHPLTYDERNNCLSFLREKNFKYLSVNRDHYDRGLLYRLDYETSGVLVYVKDENLYQSLRENFHELAKEKIYLARVCGKCELSGPFVHYLQDSMSRGMKMKASLHEFENTLKAMLSIEAQSYREEDDTTLLKINLKTGHRHQIRVQLGALGFPILGDDLYGGRASNRLYLHAYKYQIFCHDKFYEFEKKPTSF